MKVYVIYEVIGYDYEGTECQNIGVFLSRKKAIARVKQDIPKADPKGVEWDYPQPKGDDHTWYLEVYIDAYEWVEAPNTVGMSQFADGGTVGSKPYISSGAYINKMSDYCGACRYDVKQRTGPDACPYNSLYWDFLARHRDKLGENGRLFGPYRSWDRFSEETQAEIRAQAARFLVQLDAASDGY